MDQSDRFRIKKISHHQTVLPDILSYVPPLKRKLFLYCLKKSSRKYIIAYFSLIEKRCATKKKQKDYIYVSSIYYFY